MTSKIKVQVAPSGHEFEVHDGETILAAAIRHGIVLPYSCRNGACGTCKGKLIQGDVDYGDYDSSALNDSEKSAGMALFCKAVPLSDVIIEARELDAVKGIEARTLPCRVVKMEHVAHDVMVLSLKTPGSERLQYLAGQYLDILLRDSQRRSFSIANAPHDDEVLQLHIRRVPGGMFSGHVFSAMQEKDLLRFNGPLGTFFLREESVRPVIFMAGGTGFGPIKAIIEHAIASGETRQLHLYWGVRARRDLYMHELALSWAKAHDNIHYTPVLSDVDANDAWEGRSGWVHEAIAQDYADLSGHEIYACGPPPMIHAGTRVFTAQGLNTDYYYYDSFEYAYEAGQS